MKVLPKNDLAYSMMRLERFLRSRRLIFNPYTVSDSRLIEIAEHAELGDWFDLTDFAILRFTHLLKVNDVRELVGVFFTVGKGQREVYLPARQIIYGITASDSCRQVRSTLGKRKLYNHEDIKKLVGKRVFLSRVIKGVNLNGEFLRALKMYKLTGDTKRDAAIIRPAACEAKIEMLERLIENPDAQVYLDCKKGFFDYETRIRRAIEIIRHYHEYPIPEDKPT